MKKIISFIIMLIFSLFILGAGGNVEDAGLYKIRQGDWIVMQQGSDSTLYRGSFDSLMMYIDSLNHARLLSNDSLSQALRDTILNKNDSIAIARAAEISDSLGVDTLRVNNLYLRSGEALMFGLNRSYFSADPTYEYFTPLSTLGFYINGAFTAGDSSHFNTALSTVDLYTDSLAVDSVITFNTNDTYSVEEGQVAWNADDQTHN